MRELLKVGQIIRSNSGKKYNVKKLLGSGGQGEVYSVDANGREMALKWYYPHTASEHQKKTVEDIIKYGKPNDKFLWPIEIVEASGIKGFGYIMNLRPRNYRNIVDLMKRRIEPSFLSVVTACIQLTDSFLSLHEKGLCYRDISFGNVFFNPISGDILICDNDNVTIDGSGKSGVLGTPRFMAPEVVTGVSKPNMKSDLFSLSVLIFYLLMMHHPLEGKKESEIKCFDLPAMTKLYGKEPVFVYDPYNSVNRPVRGVHDNVIAFWPIYPTTLQGMFVRAFTDGLKRPLHRIGEVPWRQELVRLRNSLMYCECGMENFYDLVKVRTRQGNSSCWSCGKALKIPPRIRIGNEIVMLNRDTKLFSYHLRPNDTHDFRRVIGQVVPHPTLKDVFGLKNLTQSSWKVRTHSGVTREVSFGKSISIETGAIVDFGNIKGEIRKG